MSYATLYSKRATPQSEPIPGETQAQNAAGGFVYTLDPWKRFTRFLMLGSEAPTYYTDAKTLTRENAITIEACIAQDGIRAVTLIVEVSRAGRAPKNDPAVFALALATVAVNEETRRAAYQALPVVCRIPTHLFHFADYRKALAGWGAGVRRAIARWYTEKPVETLAYAIVKYRQRDGWSHADLLAKSHPRTTDPAREALYRWANDASFEARTMTNKAGEVTRRYPAVSRDALPAIISVFEEAQQTTDISALCRLIRDHGLTREMVPTAALTHTEVWDALLVKMPITAMLRNLGNMAKVGLLTHMSDAAQTVSTRLRDLEHLTAARIHPLAILVAMKIYSQGHSEKGAGRWSPVAPVVDALDDAFYLSFGAITPTGTRQLLALDVSGSMTMSQIAGLPITPREASAALAMVTVRTEPSCAILAFDDQLTELTISPRQRLDDVVRTISDRPFQRTDCALPMLWALHKKLPIDAIQIYTDSETWYGNTHPSQALRQYRQQMGIPTKLIVHGMTSTGFSIAPPGDDSCLDVCGFDLAVPQVVSEFITGTI